MKLRLRPVTDFRTTGGHEKEGYGWYVIELAEPIVTRADEAQAAVDAERKHRSGVMTLSDWKVQYELQSKTDAAIQALNVMEYERHLFTDAAVEGNLLEMSKIADVIEGEETGDAHFDRCAVSKHVVQVFFWSPRNTEGMDGQVTIEEARDLAKQIRAEEKRMKEGSP